MSMDANPIDVHRATDAVLVQLDVLAESHPNLLFLATSNFPQALDSAFISRCDLVLPGDAHIRVERGQRVKGGQSILADVEVPSYEPTLLKEVMETRR